VSAGQSNESEVLAQFCEALPTLAEAPARYGLGRKLDRILREARRGQPVAPLLEELGVPLGPQGRPRGPSPGSAPRPSHTELPWAVGHNADEVYLCPVGRCRRRVRREPGGPVPVTNCAVYDQPLRRAES